MITSALFLFNYFNAAIKTGIRTGLSFQLTSKGVGIKCLFRKKKLFTGDGKITTVFILFHVCALDLKLFLTFVVVLLNIYIKYIFHEKFILG